MKHEIPDGIRSDFGSSSRRRLGTYLSRYALPYVGSIPKRHFTCSNLVLDALLERKGKLHARS